MRSTFSIVLRFIIGVACIALVFKFLGVTWSDVDYFIDNGLKRAFDIFKLFGGALHS